MRPEGDVRSPISATVVGGPSTVNAWLPDLDATRAFLTSTGRTLDDAARQALTIDLALGPRAASLSPGTAQVCDAEVAALRAALDGMSKQATTHAGQMAATVAEYRTAELVAAGNFRPAPAASIVAAPPGVSLAGSHGPALLPSVVSGALPTAIAALDAVLPGSYEDAVIQISGFWGEMDPLSGPIDTTLAAGPDSHDSPAAARSITESMSQVEKMYGDDVETSHIQVQRIVDPKTGQGHWVAMLPGTSTWGPGHHSVLTGRDNTIAVSGGVSAAEAAVKRALQDAMRREGVLDKHEPVMLVGHSQGGIAMTGLASHDSGLNITDVVTYGSPVGRMPIPKKVRALNIENSRDVVPKLDGTATGDGDPRRTRLVIDDPESFMDAEGNQSLIAAHDPGRYRRDYETILSRERGNDRSAVTQFESATSVFFTGTARTYQYDARRRPGAPPKRVAGDPALRGHRGR